MDNELTQFNDIRPFEPEELPAAYDQLIANPQFHGVVEYLYPNVPFDAVAQKMRACDTSLKFQLAFSFSFIKELLAKAARGYEMDCSSVDRSGNYTFVSNHRDIVLDSAILDVLLVEAKFADTCEIAIGDNLLKLDWVKDLVRINKSFIVQRDLPMREMLVASKQLSDYMHYVISHKKQSIWIAQRSGRAKDSNDRTSEAVLKMMTMGGEGSLVERFKQLHIVPLSISYEFDPCDYLKAAELQQKRDDANWVKGPQDDHISMKTGIYGNKGHIHYHCAPCIDSFLDTIPPDTPKNKLYTTIAQHIDREIHRHYQLYPSNYIALDELRGTNDFTAHYSANDKAFFDKYLADQLAKIELPLCDNDFLHKQMLIMYANPAINQLASNGNME